MDDIFKYVAFYLGDQQYALPLNSVERVVRVAQITPIPKSPSIVLGMINVYGQLVPVFNIRQWFNLPDRDIQLTDRLIITQSEKWTIAVLVDKVTGVFEPPLHQIMRAERILPEMNYVDSVVKLDEGMLFICNLDAFPAFETMNLQKQP